MSQPVSELLEQEIRTELRQKGVVVWLDKHAHYSTLVDGLVAKRERGEFPFPVVPFRGSFLELLFALEDFGSGLDQAPLLVHLPGFTDESLRATPLLELAAPATRFRKALDTLIREAAAARVAPKDVDELLAKNPSLAEADAWLATAISQNAFGLAAYLEHSGARILADALAGPSPLAERVKSAEDLAALEQYVHRLTGLDEAWRAAQPASSGVETPNQTLTRVLHGVASWVLTVEYVHDLKRDPHEAALVRLRKLSPPLVKACTEIASHLRRDHADAYVRIADEVEHMLAAELSHMSADDLGHIDTFREEENRVFLGALEALGRAEWQRAAAYCDARRGEKSFWLQRDQARRWMWTLAEEAAAFGATLTAHARPFATVKTLDEATLRYAEGAYEVDRAHRRFEQKRLALLESSLPRYGELREVASELRRAYRTWADQLAKDFAALCRDLGFLPSSALRQRNLFEQVVLPLTQTGEKVAVFLIDAFRFEMASELAEELAAGGTQVDLKPRLAELPTITSVGMNVLAPVAKNEALVVAREFQGFRTGEYTVSDPDTRTRAMGMRSVGASGLKLELSKVYDAETAALTKQIKPHRLIVVHSKEIDDAGEANIGLPTFDSTLRQIKAAWHHLQLAGVKQAVFTADHGFLLQDETTDKRAFGNKKDPDRRHVFDPLPRAEAGMVNVSLGSLGYEGLEGYLLFREDTAVFATGNANATFVHGGNSPQERVIPVLTVGRKRIDPIGAAEYAIEVQPLADVLGLHRIRLRVCFAKETTTALGFAAARGVDLSFRVPENDQVETILKEVTAPSELKTGRMHVPISEAWTEVFFGLEGPTDGRVQLEVHHPDGIERVRSASLDSWYSVRGTERLQVGKEAGVGSAAGKSVPPPAVDGWAAAILDENVRKVFLHIEKHGVVTEPEVTTLLGSPRAFRRFSLEFEQHLPKLPFIVRIETADGGKRYVREGDR